MPINPKKLEAFAHKKDKPGGFPPGKKAPPFGKKGKMYGGKMGHKGKGPLQDWAKEEEGEHEHGGEDGEVDVQAIGERVQNGKGDKRLMRLADGVDEENNPPAWVEDEDVWEKAKDAVEPHWDEYDEPYAVVAHVYDKMGGGIKGGKKGRHHDDDGEEHDHEDEDDEYEGDE
jgi:hypothetical protein